MPMIPHSSTCRAGMISLPFVFLSKVNSSWWVSDNDLEWDELPECPLARGRLL
jgi:hypothetical protein